MSSGQGAGVAVKQNLPFIVFFNADTATHTLTASGRADKGVATTTIPFQLPAGNYLTLPTSIFSSVVDGNANGDVYWFYSDVSLGGPRGAAGSSNIAVIGGCEPASFSAVGATYVCMFGSQANAGSEPAVEVALAVPGTLSNLFVTIVPGSADLTAKATIYVNGAPSALTCSLQDPAGAVPLTMSDTVHTVVVGAGTFITLRWEVTEYTSGSVAITGWTAQLAAT